VEKIDKKVNEAILKAKENGKKDSEKLLTEMVRLEKEVEDFSNFYKNEFDKTRSKILNFATVGFRKSTKLVTLPKWTWAKVLAKLKEMRYKKFIKTKESVDKDAIKGSGIDEDQMAVFGCVIKEDDNFWYEIKKEAVQNIPKMEVATGTNG
jgi:phage host-nuclease inhibitor protein Gam